MKSNIFIKQYKPETDPPEPHPPELQGLPDPPPYDGVREENLLKEVNWPGL